MRLTSAADQTSVPAATKNTTGMLVVASSTPPSAGPRKMPTLSMVLEATLAAVSSSGLLASDGSRAAWAGRKVAEASENTALSA
jgi:hypothetical protein